MKTLVATLALLGAVPTALAQSMPPGRDALARQVGDRLQALRQQDMNPAQRALLIGRYELYLTALEALAREEQIRAATQRQAQAARQQLELVDTERERLAQSIERTRAP